MAKSSSPSPPEPFQVYEDRQVKLCRRLMPTGFYEYYLKNITNKPMRKTSFSATDHLGAVWEASPRLEVDGELILDLSTLTIGSLLIKKGRKEIGKLVNPDRLAEILAKSKDIEAMPPFGLTITHIRSNGMFFIVGCKFQWDKVSCYPTMFSVQQPNNTRLLFNKKMYLQPGEAFEIEFFKAQTIDGVPIQIYLDKDMVCQMDLPADPEVLPEIIGKESEWCVQLLPLKWVDESTLQVSVSTTTVPINDQKLWLTGTFKYVAPNMLITLGHESTGNFQFEVGEVQLGRFISIYLGNSLLGYALVPPRPEPLRAAS